MTKIEAEEVNLLDILAGFFATLKRNIILSFILPLFGVFVALAIAFNSNDVFESSLLVETSLLSENESKFLFDQLEKLGQIPGLTPVQNRQVQGFEFKVIRNENTPTDNLNERSLYLQVTAKVYNKEVFPILETAVVAFINESPPLVRHRQEREKFYSRMIMKIEEEVASMDEVKRQISSKSQATYLNPSDLYSETVELYKQKTQFEIKREEIRNVHLIKGFDSLTLDRKPRLVLMALAGFVAGFAFLCLILFVKFFAGYYQLYQRTH